MDEFINTINFSTHGKVAAVIQDIENNQVLMMAYMNEEALRKTVTGPDVWFYSRSKQRLWKKGETSGHTQTVKEIYFDCDADCVLIKVEQQVAACHNGYRSCFYRQYKEGKIVVVEKEVFDPKSIYKKD